MLRATATRRAGDPTRCARLGHGTVRARLSAFLEDQLAPIEHHALRAHLAQCPACRRVAQTLARTIALLHELPRLRAPGPARAGLARRIAQASQPSA